MLKNTLMYFHLLRYIELSKVYWKKKVWINTIYIELTLTDLWGETGKLVRQCDGRNGNQIKLMELPMLYCFIAFVNGIPLLNYPPFTFFPTLLFKLLSSSRLLQLIVRRSSEFFLPLSPRTAYWRWNCVFHWSSVHPLLYSFLQ